MDVIPLTWCMDVILNSHLIYGCYTLYLVYGCYTQHLMSGCYTPDVSMGIILQIQFNVLVTFHHTQEITQIL